jgi:hypothetical protein
MAVPASGPISISDLKAAFPAINSNSLSAYRGTKWYRSNNSRGNFGNPTISMSESYDTRPNSPVVAGSATYYGSTSFTIPLFNTLSITCKGGDGGQAGGYGYYVKDGNITGVVGSSGGGAGGTSYFGGYLSAGGGAGGGGNGGGGSAGATTSTALYITDSNQTNVSIQGITITIGVGGGGGGGAGGQNYSYKYFPYPYQGLNGYYADGPSYTGASGASGYVSVSWS